MKELEILAAQAGFRVQDCLQLDDKWHVILDDETGEVHHTGATAQEAIEKATEALVRILNRFER